MKEWLSSKKAKGFITGLVVLIATQVCGLSEDVAAMLADGIVKLTAVYLGAQGMADIGKEKAKIEKNK